MLAAALGIQRAAMLVKTELPLWVPFTKLKDVATAAETEDTPTPPSLPPRSYADVATQASSETDRPKATAPSHVKNKK